MKTQTLLASVVTGFLFLAPIAKGDEAAAPAAKTAKKAKHTKCECGDCKKGKCAKKKCEHCEHKAEGTPETKEPHKEPGAEETLKP